MMADSVTLEVKGLAELQNNIKKLNDQLATKGIKQSVAVGARVIKKQTIENAPQAESAYRRYLYNKKGNRGKKGTAQSRLVPPGGLKRAIIAKGLKDKATPTTYKYIVGVKHGIKQQAKEKDAYYWWWLENGTSKMSARPFLRPAFETKKMEAVEAIKNNLKKFIDKVGNKK